MDKNQIELKRLEIEELKKRSATIASTIATKELELAEIQINIRLLEKEIAWFNAQSGNSDIITIFNNAHFGKKIKQDIIQCTKNALLRSGYNYLSELKEMSTSELLNLKSISLRKVAVIYVICQHYGINIVLDNKNTKKMDSLKETIKEFNESIIFE